jgi:putative transposase
VPGFLAPWASEPLITWHPTQLPNSSAFLAPWASERSEGCSERSEQTPRQPATNKSSTSPTLLAPWASEARDGTLRREVHMPRAFTQNFYHAVFSTTERVEFITPDLEQRLYPFVGGILRELRCTPIAINGMPDHLHMLVRYPSDLSHANLLQHVKSRSTGWVHDTFPALNRFSWQKGYGGFTVSKSMVDTVESYIARQKEHHETQDFKTEFIELLARHGVEFDLAEVFL